MDPEIGLCCSFGLSVPRQGQAFQIQLDASLMKAGPPSLGYVNPGRGWASPFRLGTVSPWDWTGPLTTSKPLGQDQVSPLRPAPPGPGPASPLQPLSLTQAIQVLAEEVEALMGLAGSQDPVCLEQGPEPGGHFSRQGLTAQPSRREHVNTSKSAAEGGQGGGRPETPNPQSPQPWCPGTSGAAPDSKSG